MCEGVSHNNTALGTVQRGRKGVGESVVGGRRIGKNSGWIHFLACTLIDYHKWAGFTQQKFIISQF